VVEVPTEKMYFLFASGYAAKAFTIFSSCASGSKFAGATKASIVRAGIAGVFLYGSIKYIVRSIYCLLLWINCIAYALNGKPCGVILSYSQPLSRSGIPPASTTAISDTFYRDMFCSNNMGLLDRLSAIETSKTTYRIIHCKIQE